MYNKSNYSDMQKFHFDNTDKVKNTDMCYTNKNFYVNPLAYWTTEMVWKYIHDIKLSPNPLYACGFTRIGCIGCPMAEKHRNEEFKRYPTYKRAFIRTCDYIIKTRNELNKGNKHNFKTGQEYFDYWLNEPKKTNIIPDNQISIEDYITSQNK